MNGIGNFINGQKGKEESLERMLVSLHNICLKIKEEERYCIEETIKEIRNSKTLSPETINIISCFIKNAVSNYPDGICILDEYIKIKESMMLDTMKAAKGYFFF